MSYQIPLEIFWYWIIILEFRRGLFSTKYIIKITLEIAV